MYVRRQNLPVLVFSPALKLWEPVTYDTEARVEMWSTMFGPYALVYPRGAYPVVEL